MPTLKKKISFSLYSQYLLDTSLLIFFSSLIITKSLKFKTRYSLFYLFKNIYKFSFYQSNIKFFSIINKRDLKKFLFIYSLKSLGFKFNNLYYSTSFISFFFDNNIFYLKLEKILTTFLDYFYFLVLKFQL